jgi:hypothetical protein
VPKGRADPRWGGGKEEKKRAAEGEKGGREEAKPGEIGRLGEALLLLPIVFPGANAVANADAPQQDDVSCGLLVALRLFARLKNGSLATLLGQGGPDEWHAILMSDRLFSLAAVSSYEEYLREDRGRREEEPTSEGVSALSSYRALKGLQAKNVFWGFYLCGAVFAASKAERKTDSYWWTSDLYLRPRPGGELALTNLPPWKGPEGAWRGSQGWIALHFNIKPTSTGAGDTVSAPHLTLRGWGLNYFSNYPEARRPEPLDPDARRYALEERRHRQAFVFSHADEERPYGDSRDATYSRQLAVYVGDDPYEIFQVPPACGVVEAQKAFLFQLHTAIRATVLATNELTISFAEIDWKGIKRGIFARTKMQFYPVSFGPRSAHSEDGLELLFDPEGRTLTLRHRLGLHLASFRLDPARDDPREPKGRQKARRSAKGEEEEASRPPTEGVSVLLDADEDNLADRPIAIGDGLCEDEPIAVSGKCLPRAAFAALLRPVGTWRVEEGQCAFTVGYPFLPVFALMRSLCAAKADTAELAFFRFFDASYWEVAPELVDAKMGEGLKRLTYDLRRFCQYLLTLPGGARKPLLHRLRVGAPGWRRLREVGDVERAEGLVGAYLAWLVEALTEVDHFVWGGSHDIIVVEGFLLQTACFCGLRPSANLHKLADSRPWIIVPATCNEKAYARSRFFLQYTRAAGFPVAVVVLPTVLVREVDRHQLNLELERAGVARGERVEIFKILDRNEGKVRK